MMSEDHNQLKLQAQMTREKINEWFDRHPKPWEIDAHWFTMEIDGNYTEIHVYFCENVFDYFQIRIRCKTAKRAEYLNRLLYKTTSQMGIEQLLLNKELFLLRSFF